MLSIFKSIWIALITAYFFVYFSLNITASIRFKQLVILVSATFMVNVCTWLSGFVVHNRQEAGVQLSRAHGWMHTLQQSLQRKPPLISVALGLAATLVKAGAPKAIWEWAISLSCPTTLQWADEAVLIFYF